MGLNEAQRFKHLYDIMKVTRRNKRRGRDSIAFEMCWAPLLVRAFDARDEKTLRILMNYTFLAPRPRWREIFATEFGGRMIDHEICEPVIPEAENVLSPYTYNNRKEKGSQAAINQLMEHVFNVTEGYTSPARIVKIDFKGFFPNALWDVAEECIDRVIDRLTCDEDYKAYLKWLTMISVHCNPAAHCERRTAAYLWDEHIEPEKSIMTKPEGVGAAIGRLIWQTGMGLYINDEIVWLTDECGFDLTCFVDDLVFVVPEERHQQLLATLPELRRRLARKNVYFNERKFYDQPAVYGCEFLGSHIRPNRIHLNNKTYDAALKRIEELNESRYKDIDAMVDTFNSYGGLLKNRTDYQRLLELRDKLAPEWWQWLEWNEEKLCLAYREGWSKEERLNRKYHLCITIKKKNRNEKGRNRRSEEGSDRHQERPSGHVEIQGLHRNQDRHGRLHQGRLRRGDRVDGAVAQ